MTTKIHACVDALGNPLRLILTGGQVADVTQGAALVANMPLRSNRINQRPVDWHRYKARHLVECFFNRLKYFRRIASRYDKLSSRFRAVVHLACAYIWLL